MKMLDQQGMILVSVLLFLFLIDVLILCELQFSLLQIRMARNEILQAQSFSTAQGLLHKITFSLIRSPFLPCEINPLSTIFAQFESSDWWNNLNACQGKLADNDFKYVVEKMPIQPCLQINNQAAQFWRITVWVIYRGSVSIQQATIALPTRIYEKCMNKQLKRVLTNTWQSWVLLND